MIASLFLSFFLAASLTRYDVSSLQADLAQLRERIENQDAVIDSMRKEIGDHLVMSKELAKGSASSFQNRVQSLETVLKDLSLDLLKLKQNTDSSLKKVEQEIGTTIKNVSHLETAIKSVLEALGGDKGEAVAISSDKSYIVKEGDSLGKIAQSQGTSVKVLKELNHLTKDTIRIGQKLYVP